MKINPGYIEKNLIAYIGNKRRLLPLIKTSIEKTNILKTNKENIKFLDLFAGTGCVSRLAKNLGFETYSNDWEYYSYIMNKVFVELDDNFIKNSFKNFGGIKNTLNILNNLPEVNEDDKYISKYYCPENDDNPDIENERMFFTNYNGIKIDSIRSKIDEWSRNLLINHDEEQLLIALLIYEVSTRSNTSGVFKGFHRGFGGTNGDALTRILKEIKLDVPTLINGKKCYVSNEDAVELSEELSSIKFDIVYLDPPYNQHQYGSNYHLLNTIALYDKPPVNKNIFIDGKKINKSAIRRDWIKTKSTFCYKDTAKNDFIKIIKNINSDFILVSYSTDGIIPFDEMLEILSTKGKLDIVISEYVKFRGGKQALTSEIKNIEFIIMVDSTKERNITDIIKIQNILTINRISLLMKKVINPIFAESIGFEYKNKVKSTDYNIERILFKNYDDYNVEYCIHKNKILNSSNTLSNFSKLPFCILEIILKDLEFITNITKEDEIYLSLNEINKLYLKEQYDQAFEVFKNIPYLLSKFNNKKAYLQSLKTIISLLKLMNQSIEIWRYNNLLESKSFEKLEKIILLKLNYPFENEDEASSDKKKISIYYEMLIDILENKKVEIKKVMKKQKIKVV